MAEANRIRAAVTLRALALGAAGLAAHPLRGCASDPAGARFVGPTVGSPQTATITADWDDVDAAVEVGSGEAEMAVTFDETPSPDERVFYLRTIRDEPAKLTVRRTTHAPTPTITMEARAGIFGRPDDEARLLRAVAGRLEDLRGVDFAPPRGH